MYISRKLIIFGFVSICAFSAVWYSGIGSNIGDGLGSSVLTAGGIDSVSCADVPGKIQDLTIEKNIIHTQLEQVRAELRSLSGQKSELDISSQQIQKEKERLTLFEHDFFKETKFDHADELRTSIQRISLNLIDLQEKITKSTNFVRNRLMNRKVRILEKLKEENTLLLNQYTEALNTENTKVQNKEGSLNKASETLIQEIAQKENSRQNYEAALQQLETLQTQLINKSTTCAQPVIQTEQANQTEQQAATSVTNTSEAGASAVVVTNTPVVSETVTTNTGTQSSSVATQTVAQITTPVITQTEATTPATTQTVPERSAVVQDITAATPATQTNTASTEVNNNIPPPISPLYKVRPPFYDVDDSDVINVKQGDVCWFSFRKIANQPKRRPFQGVSKWLLRGNSNNYPKMLDEIHFYINKKPQTSSEPADGIAIYLGPQDKYIPNYDIQYDAPIDNGLWVMGNSVLNKVGFLTPMYIEEHIDCATFGCSALDSIPSLDQLYFSYHANGEGERPLQINGFWFREPMNFFVFHGCKPKDDPLPQL